MDRRNILGVEPQVLRKLEDETAVFRRMFPDLQVRFCEILGRRISHLAGDTSEIRTGEMRMGINDGLLMFISGPWQNVQDALEIYAESLRSKFSLQDTDES